MPFPPESAAESLLRAHIRLWPDALHARAISRLWNLLMRSQPCRDRLAELEGKRVAITLTDTGSQWAFRIRDGRIHALAARAGWDVRIRGPARSLIRLGLGREEADTLFFNRRIIMEGETATGVHLKNFLDTLEFDWEAHHRVIAAALPGPLRDPCRELLTRLRPEERVTRWAKRSFRARDGDPGQVP